MRRKLVRQGRNALTVTLPADWTSKYGLKAGDDIEVEDIQKGLLITTEKERFLQNYEFDARNIKEFKNNYLSYFYHQGFDEVKILYDDPAVLKAVMKKLGDLMGYEIVETGKNYMLVKSVSKADENEFDAILRRSFILMKSMGKECFDALCEQNYAKLEEIRNLEKTNNKFTDFCIRILNKRGYIEGRKTIPLYLLVRDLEKLCDNYKYLCDLMKGCRKGFALDDSTLQLFGKANGYFEEFYGLFYKFDEAKMQEFIDRRKGLLEEGYLLMKNKKNEEAMLIHHLINILNQIFDLKGPLFEMNLG